jgi:hypothetical protein
MKKSEFYKNLETQNLPISDKLNTCQYFIDNYPIKLTTWQGVMWTKLDIRIEGGSRLQIEKDFNSLVSNIDELKKFDEL